jgi:hypothetical protein
MSFVSYGYAAPSGAIASINTQAWGMMARNLGVEYAVEGPAALQVTAAAGDRTVQYAAGVAVGQGIMDVADVAANTHALPAASTGQRWYVVGLRRNWLAGTGATSFTNFGFSTLTDENAAIAAVLAARQQAPGTGSDDQPLAAVLVVAGQTQPQAIRDLRCWHGSGGGLVGRSTHVLGYLARAGTTVYVNEVQYVRLLTTSGAPGWRSTTDRTAAHVVGTSGSLTAGSVAAGDGGFMVQAGSVVQNTNSSGVARVTFPLPFPNGLLTVLLTNGDQASSRSLGEVLHFEMVHPATKNYFDYVAHRSDSFRFASQLHRLNFIAIGY